MNNFTSAGNPYSIPVWSFLNQVHNIPSVYASSLAMPKVLISDRSGQSQNVEVTHRALGRNDHMLF